MLRYSSGGAMVFAVLALFLAFSAIGFRFSRALPSVSSPLHMSVGGHNQRFHFLPVVRGSNEMHYPRIMNIAGIFTSIGRDDVLAPYSNPPADVGKWTYDFPDPEFCKFGTVAIPGSEIITAALDPVVIIAKNTDLGISIVEEVEMLLVIDRAINRFEPDTFFLFEDPMGKLVVLWMTELEHGYTALGKVLVCCAPYTESMRPKSSGWAEEDDSI